MNLHASAAVAEGLRGSEGVGLHVACRQQVRVQRLRRDRGEHRSTGADRRAIGEGYASRAPVADIDASHLGIRAHLATGIGDDAEQCIHDSDATADRHGASAEGNGCTDHLGNERTGGIVRTKAVVQGPRCKQCSRDRGVEGTIEPWSSGLEQFGATGDELAAAELTESAPAELERGLAPEVSTEQPEGEIDLGPELRHHGIPVLSVTVTPELLGGDHGIRRENR